MKIQFTQPHTDAFGKSYQPGWVADWSQPDAERAIAEGFAVQAPEGAYPRKTSAPSFECAVAPPFTPTGETTDLGELVQDEPDTAKEIEKPRGFTFTKAGKLK